MDGDKDNVHKDMAKSYLAALPFSLRDTVILTSSIIGGALTGGIGALPMGIVTAQIYDGIANSSYFKQYGSFAPINSVSDNQLPGKEDVEKKWLKFFNNKSPFGYSSKIDYACLFKNEGNKDILNTKTSNLYQLIKTKPVLSSPKLNDLDNEYKKFRGNARNIFFQGNKLKGSIPKKLEICNDNISIVGIDLGTTRCCAAVNRHKGIESVALDNMGERLLPSYVSFNDKNEKCGSIVIKQLQTYAKSTIYDSKRIIGKDFESVLIDENWPFEIQNKNGKPIFIIEQGTKYVEKSPEDVAAVLLKHIKLKVETFQGKELNEVVITVPAAFGDSEKEATCNAAKLAGWEIVHLIPEPVAAAIAYFVDRPVPKEFNMLLFDFGGGTLDVCIFDVNSNFLKIICYDGDTCLGGRDFDNILFSFFSNILKHQYKINVNRQNKWKYGLMQKCADIKHTLSIEHDAILDVSDFNPNIEKAIKVTRQEFDKMAANILFKIKDTVIRTLSTTKYTSQDIDKVLLVGGSSRIPVVKTLLQTMFSKAEHHCDENPDEVVAMGAAYYAYDYKTKMIQNSN